jgi:hypothetical protein
LYCHAHNDESSRTFIIGLSNKRSPKKKNGKEETKPEKRQISAINAILFVGNKASAAHCTRFIKLSTCVWVRGCCMKFYRNHLRDFVLLKIFKASKNYEYVHKKNSKPDATQVQQQTASRFSILFSACSAVSERARVKINFIIFCVLCYVHQLYVHGKILHSRMNIE